MTVLRKSYLSQKGMLFAAFMLSLSLVQTAWAGDWNLKDKDGTHYQLADLRGKWVLVNFWAPWCPVCLQEMPELNALQQQRKNLQIIGVAVMFESRKEVLDSISKHSIGFPTVFGNEDIAGDFGGMNGMPTSFLYTPEGKLLGRHEGPLTKSEIEQVLEQKPEAVSLFTR
jgi:thiol-disulfide isomerase/thioredoxin